MVMLEGYAHMVDLFTSIPWWTLNPDDELIRQADRRAATTEPTHIVYTRDKQGQAAMYIDGQLIASKAVPGELTNWDPGFRLALANELTGDRPWLGEYYGIAIWDSARTAAEAAGRFRAGMRAKPADRPLVHYTFAENRGDTEMRFRTTSTTPNGEPSLWSSWQETGGGPNVTALRSDSGELAVLYFARGGQATLDPSRLAGTIKAEWYNPRDGSRRPAEPVAPNTYRAPDGEDWALLLRK